MSERTWACEGEPRWTISKWSSGQQYVDGPFIETADESLVGMKWVEAAKVEVVPLSQLTAAQERIAGLERAETEWRMAWDEAQDRLQRIVEAGNAAVDVLEALDPTVPEIAAYREAVGGESDD